MSKGQNKPRVETRGLRLPVQETITIQDGPRLPIQVTLPKPDPPPADKKK